MDGLLASQYIAATRDQPFVIGENDCALWCAGLVHLATGVDPAADLRGTYSTKFEYRKIAMAAGGLLNLIAVRMDRLDLPVMSVSGVAVAVADRETICGIVIRERMVVKTDRGVRIHDDFEILRGWECRKP